MVTSRSTLAGAKLPFRMEVRKAIYRHTQANERDGIEATFVFLARNGHRLSYRNGEHALRCLLGVAQEVELLSVRRLFFES